MLAVARQSFGQMLIQLSCSSPSSESSAIKGSIKDRGVEVVVVKGDNSVVECFVIRKGN